MRKCKVGGMHGLRIAPLVLLIAPAVCGLALALPACGTTDVYFHYVDAGVDVDADAGIDSDAGADAGPISSRECTVGECTRRPSGWDGPLWAWIGPTLAPIGSEGAPDCPSGTSDREGYTDLVHPDECEPCSCDPSHGSCELPSQFTASTETCAAGTPSIPFDAPPAWDGTCDAKAQLPAGIAKSLTIAPLTVGQESCAVAVSIPKPPAARVVTPYWQTLARTCVGDDWQQCGGPNRYCIDKMKAPFPDARLCVLQPGESGERCDMEWPERYLLYEQDIDDKRKCTECACDPPMGSMCTAQVYVYSDAACTVPVDPGYTVSSVVPKCIDIAPPGQPLLSKSAKPPTYISGTCEPIQGKLDPDGGTLSVKPSFTLCCKP